MRPKHTYLARSPTVGRDRPQISLLSFEERAADPHGYVLGPREHAFDDDGVHTIAPHYESLVRWSAVIEVVESPLLVLFMLDTAAALAVPKRVLEPSGGLEKLRTLLPARLRSR